MVPKQLLTVEENCFFLVSTEIFNQVFLAAQDVNHISVLLYPYSIRPIREEKELLAIGIGLDRDLKYVTVHMEVRIK